MNDDPDSTGLSMEIAILDSCWHEILPDLSPPNPLSDNPTDEINQELVAPDGLIQRAAAAAFADAAPKPLRGNVVELSLVLVDDAHIRVLNNDYRGLDKPTNVLSFAALDDDDALPSGTPVLLGDVILARETILREAADQGKAVTSHVSHLVVHGVLHLLGFDHETDEDAEEMEGREIAILESLKIANPYHNISGGELHSDHETMTGLQ